MNAAARDQVKSGEPVVGKVEAKSTPRTRMNSGDPRRSVDAQSIAPRLLTMREAAGYLAVSYWTVRSWVESGKLASVRLPGDGRLVRIERAVLDRVIEQSRVPLASAS